MAGNAKEEENEPKPSEMEIFGLCGPLHLTCVDWSIADHRRSIAASLVQGVYILARDRKQNRIGPKALAPVWWDFFHFQCIKILIDQVDSIIFGAIYEYKSHNPNDFHPMTSQSAPPKYVIAFRGIVPGVLTPTSRYQIGFQAVKSIIVDADPRNVWLAGHSIGAAMALQVGKDMAKRGCYIETYLFNPPFSSVPFEVFNSPHLKSGARFASGVVTAGLSISLMGTTTKYPTQIPDPFTVISPWIPYLFVNPKDPICCEYIRYFEHPEKMEGCSGREGEALHLIPSAIVTKNMIVNEQDITLAHGIHQWWQAHPYWDQKLYQYR